MKYGARVRAAGAVAFEGACIEQKDPFGYDLRQVIRYIADAGYGGGPSPAKDLFSWKAVQHIAWDRGDRAVVFAHDNDVRRIPWLVTC